MWRRIVEYFQDTPMRLEVAQAIISHGFKVNEPGDISCGSIRVPLKSIGDALGIDRRTVRVTTEDICKDEGLFRFFSNLEPAGSSLEGVRKILGYGVVIIHVESPGNPGILSQVTSVISGYGVAIRQVIAEDVAIHREPCLKVITQTPLPGAAIEVLSGIEGVSRVILKQ